MSTGRSISFANFICKFGDEKDLLDLAEEIVIPAFLNENLSPRSYNGTSYFFHDTQLLNLARRGGKPVLALAGRLVKDTVLTREQVFDPKLGLQKKSARMASSPSAIFVLVLNNHKLVYCPETSFAPSLSSFKSTAASYIKQQQKAFINTKYEALKTGRMTLESEEHLTSARVTKKGLWQEYPLPTLEVVPIPSELSLSDFIRRYKQLSSVSIRVLRTNSEINNAKLIKLTRATGGLLNAESSTITHSGGKEGLNKVEAATQLKAVALDGNAELKLSGKDQLGNTLIGNNEEFKLRVHLDAVPEDVPSAAVKLHTAMNDEIVKSNLKLAETESEPSIQNKIAQIAHSLNVQL